MYINSKTMYSKDQKGQNGTYNCPLKKYYIATLDTARTKNLERISKINTIVFLNAVNEVKSTVF